MNGEEKSITQVKGHLPGEDEYQERTVTDEDLRSEYGYIVASKLLKEMLDQDLITLDQYLKIDQKNRETFSPHLAGLMPSNR